MGDSCPLLTVVKLPVNKLRGHSPDSRLRAATAASWSWGAAPEGPLELCRLPVTHPDAAGDPPRDASSSVAWAGGAWGDVTEPLMGVLAARGDPMGDPAGVPAGETGEGHSLGVSSSLMTEPVGVADGEGGSDSGIARSQDPAAGRSGSLAVQLRSLAGELGGALGEPWAADMDMDDMLPSSGDAGWPPEEDRTPSPRPLIADSPPCNWSPSTWRCGAASTAQSSGGAERGRCPTSRGAGKHSDTGTRRWGCCSGAGAGAGGGDAGGGLRCCGPRDRATAASWKQELAYAPWRGEAVVSTVSGGGDEAGGGYAGVWLMASEHRKGRFRWFRWFRWPDL